jgi:hypothetical protein
LVSGHVASWSGSEDECPDEEDEDDEEDGAGERAIAEGLFDLSAAIEGALHGEEAAEELPGGLCEDLGRADGAAEEGGEAVRREHRQGAKCLAVEEEDIPGGEGGWGLADASSGGFGDGEGDQ